MPGARSPFIREIARCSLTFAALVATVYLRDLLVPCSYNDGKHTFYTSGDVTAFTHLIAQLLGPSLEDRLDVRPIAWLADRLEVQPRP